MTTTSCKTLYKLLILSSLLTLAACGGGGGGNSPPPPAATQTLSGTAAAGAPIIGRVTIKDSAGTVRSTAVAADGSYTLDVSGLTPPFALRLEGTAGGRSYVLHSAATAADINGTINITPLTDLIVANVARQIAANYFDAGNFSALTSADLNAAENALQQRLQAVLTDVGVAATIDLLRAAFRADHTGLDAALDILRVSVDTATNTALITNVINNANITDDLALSSDTSLLNSTGTVSGLSDWNAIRARIASLEAAFATSLPAANDPLLLAQFDQTGFLNSGDDLATFLGDLTTRPTNVGFRFGVSLVSLVPATTGQNGRAVITMSEGDATYGYNYFDLVMTGIYDNSTGGTNWVIAGDQRIVENDAKMRSTLGFNSSNRNQIQSGIDLNFKAKPAGNIDYAVVTGPGLPTSGGGANGASPGVLLVIQPVFGGSFWVASGPYTGPNTPQHPRAVNHWTTYTWTDAEIATLPSDNLIYTARFYDDSGTPTNLADDILLDTYPFTLLKPPLPAGGLSAASFLVITGPATSDVLNIYNTGGPLTMTWTLPAGLAAEHIEALRFYASGGFDNVFADVTPTTISQTLQITAPTGTVTSGWLDATARDFYNRNYSYKRWMP